MSTLDTIQYYKGLSIVILVFGIIGITFLITCGSIIPGVTQYMGDDYVRTTAEVESVVQRGYVRDEDESVLLVSYTFHGQQYLNLIDYHSSDIMEGESVEVFVSMTNPNHIKEVDGVLAIPIVFGCVGGAFFIVSAICAVVLLVKKNKINHLITYGLRVEAPIVDVIENMSISINGIHPYRIVCQYTDITREIDYTYYSQDIWYYPDFLVADETIKVYIDRNDPKVYFLDMTEINRRRKESLMHHNTQPI